MRWISKNINFYGSDERIAFASLNTSSVNFVASFPSRGSLFFCKSALIHRHAVVIRVLQANKNPSEKKLFPGRFKSVSSRQTGSCLCVIILLS